MFSHFFIDRPIFSAVIALVISVVGVVAMVKLPIAQYPQVTPIQIQVTATYPGANATLVAQNVGAPIEQQVNGANNMIYMSSTNSSTGNYTLTVYFTIDTDPSLAQVDVQNRVSQAMAQLPQSVQAQGVDVQQKTSTFLMVLAFYSPDGRYDADLHLQLHQHPDPRHDQPHQRRQPGFDLRRARIRDARLAEARPHGAARDLDQRDRQRDQEPEPAVRGGPDRRAADALSGQADIPRHDQHDHRAVAVRQHDPAQPERRRGAGAGEGRGLHGPRRAELLAAHELPGQARDADRRVPAARRQRASGLEGRSRHAGGAVEELPDGLEYDVALDTTLFVQASIDEVVKTFFEAVVLVVLVVFIFLHSLRLTIIPTLAVPVSILGALVGMLVFGFSINMLTLFGMILAIGLVVDDAIVVVENTERNMVQFGLSPRDAAKRAMDEVSGAGDRRRAGAERRVHPGGVPGRHHRRAVQAVRGDHRHLGGVLGPRRAHAVAGAGGHPDQGQARSEEGLLQVVRRHASTASPTAT